MADTKISPYSLNDLKNTTDDALGNYLRGLKFTQDNSKLDFRLAVGYIAVVIAAVTFVADKRSKSKGKMRTWHPLSCLRFCWMCVC